MARSGDGDYIGASSERSIPHNLEAEESLLGAMLLSKDAIGEALERCSKEDFYKPSHQIVFEAIQRLNSKLAVCDTVSVSDELRRMGKLEAVGGTGYLIELLASTPTMGSAARYATIVEEYSLLRKLIAAATKVAEMSYSVPEDVNEVLDKAESLIFEISSKKSSNTLVALRDALNRTLDDLEARSNSSDHISGISTGLDELDELLSGLQKSAMIIVGARPAMGKTAFALGIASHVSARQQLPVLIFSLEMSHIELTQRILASEARVDSKRLKNGDLSNEEWQRISKTFSTLGSAPLYIDDSPNVSVLDIRTRARKLKANLGELGLIVVDYLQLMSGGMRAESRQVQVSEISRGLKLLARELEVPVVALSQLSRGVESRQDKRPTLADLRESGCLDGSSKILLASGEEVTIASLERLTPYGPVEVISYDDETGTLVPAIAKRAYLSGYRPIFKVEIEGGEEIVSTLNHRYLTRDGWKMLWQINEGEEVAIATDGDAAGCGREGGSLKVASRVVTYRRFVEIHQVGFDAVYDLEVEGHHNFVANGVVVHNSLEQDADVVMFISRDTGGAEDEFQDKNSAEIIIAKHRSGPIGSVNLTYIPSFTKFANRKRPKNQYQSDDN
ncbi:MAG: replicative DNA helicase [Actinomycetota bacterium]|jgi:replicative DNA helicase|nr:replicative DNA helicase [Actinomycetota bacterium]